MFIPLLLRGKSPVKTKHYVTGIFSECVVTYGTRRKFLLRVREFLFHKTCLHLPLSWFRFCFVSFSSLYTGHPNNFFSEADRRHHISPQETGDFLSLIRHQLQFKYYTDANRRRHFTKVTEWLNQNDSYSNVLEGRVRHEASLRGICGEGIIVQNAYRRVSQYSCKLHRKSCFLLRKNYLRKNVSYVWDMWNADKILVRKSERNKHLRDLAGTLQ